MSLSAGSALMFTAFGTVRRFPIRLATALLVMGRFLKKVYSKHINRDYLMVPHSAKSKICKITNWVKLKIKQHHSKVLHFFIYNFRKFINFGSGTVGRVNSVHSLCQAEREPNAFISPVRPMRTHPACISPWS